MLGAVGRRSSRRAAERAASAAESLLPRSSGGGGGAGRRAATAASPSLSLSAPSHHRHQHPHLRYLWALWQQQSASFAAKAAASAAPPQRQRPPSPRPPAATGGGGGDDETGGDGHEEDDGGGERASASSSNAPAFTRIRLVRPDGTHAVVSRTAAAREAKAAGLDLVPVRSARADPPVFRLAALDAEAAAARAREKHKRERHLAARRREETKEVRISVRSERHDAETRLRRCRELVGKGWKVRLVVPVERPERRALQAAQAADAAAEAAGSVRGGGNRAGWGNRRGDRNGGDDGDGDRSHRDVLLGGLRSAALGRLRELRGEAEEFADVSSPDADSGAKPRGPGGGAVVWALLSPRDGGARR